MIKLYHTISPKPPNLATGLWKAAGCGGILPEMLKLWIEEFDGLVVCVKLLGGRAPKDGQARVIIPIHKKGDRSKCINYRRIST